MEMRVYKIDDYVLKYRIGHPFETEAVIRDGEEIEKNTMDYFKISQATKLRLTYKMNTDDIVLGLGENQRGINKRGGIYESYCTDDPNHTPDKKSLYGAHNFLIVDGAETFGVFIDYPGRVTFDVGFTHKDYLEIIVDDNNLDIYIINGNNLKEIVKSFLKLVGQCYVPPKWAFGYQQCRWSYEDAAEVENIADSFIKNDIPCDAIYLDIDYMEDFKDFTISHERFPNFKAFVEKMKKKGFRLIPIIDAGVKIEKGYDVYEEGVANDFFCVDQDGKPFVGAVWPGRVHFPDFLNPEARKWFGLKYKTLLDCGIEGFWNDMNEPAIFYTDRGLNKAIKKAKKSEDENLNIYSFFELKDTFIKISNNLEDYKSFYHKVKGELVNHDKVHNLYGYNMTRAAAEGFEKIKPNKRVLIFSRSSYIGMHRYSGIWTGDNHSWWDHILLNIKMMPSLNMCGFLYSGADTGGFNGDANAELVTRWTQFSIFTPLFRNHSAMGTRNQEPFAFDEESKEIMKRAIELRYAIIPYIYSEYMKAVINWEVYFAPLVFEYDDEMSRKTEDQLLVGDSIMISPIYQENVTGRYVWVPEDMLLWKVKKYSDREYEIVKKGHRYLNVEIKEIPVFIRKNKMLILGKHAKNVESIDNRQLDIIAFIEDKTSYIYYDDDGKTYDFKKGKYSEIAIEIEKADGEFKINIDNRGNEKVQRLNFEIIDVDGSITKKSVDIN
jgi:alpha-glucosidase